MYGINSVMSLICRKLTVKKKIKRYGITKLFVHLYHVLDNINGKVMFTEELLEIQKTPYSYFVVD